MLIEIAKVKIRNWNLDTVQYVQRNNKKKLMFDKHIVIRELLSKD